MRRKFSPAIALALFLTSPAAVRPQAEVTALASGSDPIESTDQLRLSRFADFSEEATVAVGTMLEVGDLLSSASETIDVELGCGEESVLRFSGGFRLLINSPAETDCAVDLLSGTVDVLTDAPAEVGAGDVTLGVEGTQFSLSLSRTEEGPEEDLAVFEGTVRLRSGDAIDSVVETGRSWKRAKGEQIWGEVSEARNERTAALFARIEVAKSVAAGEEVGDKEKVYSELKQLHLAVLSKPAEVASRIELAKAQLELKRDSTAAYHLKRADVTTEEELETYEVDKRVMPLIQKIETSRGPGTDLQSESGPETGLTTRVQMDPFVLIRYDKYEEAIEILEKRAASGPTARIYYGLAKAYSGLEGGSSARAGAYADRALSLHKSGDKLAHEEYMACRRIRARADR